MSVDYHQHVRTGYWKHTHRHRHTLRRTLTRRDTLKPLNTHSGTPSTHTNTHPVHTHSQSDSILVVWTRNILLLYIICHYDDYTWNVDTDLDLDLDSDLNSLLRLRFSDSGGVSCRASRRFVVLHTLWPWRNHSQLQVLPPPPPLSLHPIRLLMAIELAFSFSFTSFCGCSQQTLVQVSREFALNFNFLS